VREADDLTTFMCRMSWKSGSLNLLQPSGPHRACYGTAFYLLHLDPLQPPPSIFYVVFLFFLFLTLWLLQYVLAFFGLAFFQHDHPVLVGGIFKILHYLPPSTVPFICLFILIPQRFPYFKAHILSFNSYFQIF